MKNTKKIILPIVGIVFLIAAYNIIDAMLFDGVKAQVIKEEGFQGNYYAKEDSESKTTVILVGGGQWGDYWGQYLAKNDMVGFSLPYTGMEGLPDLPENIALEYFEHAINWLTKQPAVNSDKIVVMGASKNAELALVLAANFPNIIDGVVAYAPSSVSWSNTALPYNSDELKASWTYNGEDIPFIPMEKIKADSSNQIDMLGYWEKGLSQSSSVETATIPVENINGPILLISGNDDQVWPSAKMADMIEKRLKENAFAFTCLNLKYDNSGHSISGNPDDNTAYGPGYVRIGDQDYEYAFGGDAEGDFKAKQDARNQLMEFLKF